MYVCAAHLGGVRAPFGDYLTGSHKTGRKSKPPLRNYGTQFLERQTCTAWLQKLTNEVRVRNHVAIGILCDEGVWCTCRRPVVPYRNSYMLFLPNHFTNGPIKGSV